MRELERFGAYLGTVEARAVLRLVHGAGDDVTCVYDDVTCVRYVYDDVTCEEQYYASCMAQVMM